MNKEEERKGYKQGIFILIMILFIIALFMYFALRPENETTEGDIFG